MRHLCASALFLAWAFLASAQTVPSHEGRVSFSVQGAPVLNIYENAFSYRDNGVAAQLITFQAGVGVGFDFTESFGLRGQFGFGTDAGAANTRETAGGGFYPYKFKHVNFFLDAVMNLSGLKGRATAFRPRLYAGLGGAYTFGFTDPHHPWQTVRKKNIVPGFRAGFIAEYTFVSGLGLFIDLCGEAYTDLYNGLKPTEEEQKRYEGYGGFPFDLRGMLSLGMIYYF